MVTRQVSTNGTGLRDLDARVKILGSGAISAGKKAGKVPVDKAG